MRDDVAAMVAKRDQLDREQEQQRRLEESAFERYARAQERIIEIEQSRDVVLAELDRRREEAVAEAEAEAESIGAQQCAVLAELHGRQRSAEDLAAMFGLPVKRVRTMLRRTRDEATSGGQAPVGAMSDDDDAAHSPTEAPPDQPRGVDGLPGLASGRAPVPSAAGPAVAPTVGQG
ncbi:MULTISPECIES: hypothetical protein [unclassified Pseudonocardia]|uniref:hypothetical protein n=1 Tax=unclassified Pseudonocardia TaxID=2619320 RepID=UPI0001FFE9DA|nr:hypothetical protein [Pseudonocardia sp. Ae707_Ps1]